MDSSKYKKPRFTKKSYSRFNSKSKNQLDPGQYGFLVTCNFREKDCVRECYNILNSTVDEIQGEPTQQNDDNHDVDVDISEELDNEIMVSKQKRNYRFHQSDTGATNCIFIQSLIPDPDPLSIGLKVISDTANSSFRPRYILRFIPIEIICRANMKDIIDNSGILFDKYLLKEAKTFAIVYNRRLNNSLHRDEIIQELANLVTMKNAGNKVNLKDPQLTVIVEVIKGICCLSVLPDYFKHKKYNLAELCTRTETNEIVDIPTLGDQIENFVDLSETDDN